MTLESIRNVIRMQFMHELNHCKESQVFDECMIPNYELKIATKSHQNELLNTVSFCYSALNPMRQIFRITTEDNVIVLADKVKKLIETGTYIVLINKRNNAIIGGVGYLDLCEIYQSQTIRKKEWFLRQQICDQIVDLYFSNDKIATYKDLNEIMKLRSSTNTYDNMKYYYGKWCELTLYFIHPKFSGKGYGSFLLLILKSISHKLNYSTIASAHNPRSIKSLGRSVAQLRFIDVVFDDTTTMIQYFDELKIKYNVNESTISQYKKLSVHFFVNYIEKRKPIPPWDTILKSKSAKRSKL
eukprot:275514_1